MRKGLFFAILTAIILLASTTALAGGKSLCDFPFGPNGSVNVYYDVRNFDSDFFNPNYHPKGGIKLVVETGYFPTEKEALKMGKKIKKVVFTNTTRNLKIELKDGYYYIFTDAGGNRSHMMDYFIWLGQLNNVLGDWEVTIDAKGGKYKGAFSITQDMVDRPSPVPVDVTEVTYIGIFNGVESDRVDFTDTGADQYKIRGILSSVYDGIPYDKFLFDVTNPQCDGSTCTAIVPHYDGLRCRIESRYNGDWFTLGGAYGWECNEDFMTPYFARSSTYFRLPVLP